MDSLYRFLMFLCICLATATSCAGARPPRRVCHCLPHESCFPSPFAWSFLNHTLNGRLLQLRPLAYPCHNPNYDEVKCNLIKENAGDALWRSGQPSAIQHPLWETYHNYTCFLNFPKNTTCAQGSVPLYAVQVEEANDVSKAFEFAYHNNIRLVVKNTGHDALGREMGVGSLMLWTHKLKKMEFHESFVPNNCHVEKGVPAVTIGAGVQWDEVYSAADKLNRSVVGAYSRTVGASGGYILGGGHSILTPSYGFAVDNVLQLELVTPDGKYKVANKCQNKELYWALLGGGGSTFGVVLSSTHKTHSSVPIVQMMINISVNKTSDMLHVFYGLGMMQSSLSLKHWGGTFKANPAGVRIDYILPNGTASDAESDWSDFVSEVKMMPAVQVTQEITTYTSFYPWFESAMCQHFPDTCTDHGGSNEVLASRLIPETILMNSTSVLELASAIIEVLSRNSSNGAGNAILGMAVGKSPSNETCVENALNPAWRKSLWHVIISALWQDGASDVEMKHKLEDVTETNKLFVNVTPDSGAYMNEADYNEPNWRESFYGSHYPRLLDIKRSVDPTHLLACHHCVGSEVWDEDFVCRNC